MARAESQVRGGFYALEEKWLPHIANLFRPFEGNIKPRMLDACAGQGEALAYLSSAWNLTPYANELDTRRYEDCVAKFGRANSLNDDFFKFKTSLNSFAVQLLNPPYDSDALTGKQQVRMETRFLRGSWYMLAKGGYNIIVVYTHHIDERFAMSLIRMSESVQVYRMPENHLERYMQIVIVAKARKGNYLGDEDVIRDAAALVERAQLNYAWVRGLRDRNEEPDYLWERIDTVTEPRYTIPNVGHVSKFIWKPGTITDDMRIESANRTGAHLLSTLQTDLMPEDEDREIQPLTRPRMRQMGGLIGGGLFNGLRLTTSKGEAVVRSSIRRTEMLVDGPDADAKPNADETYVYRLLPETNIKVLYETGDIEDITGDESMAQFIRTYKDALVHYAKTRFKAQYEFDFIGGGWTWEGDERVYKKGLVEDFLDNVRFRKSDKDYELHVPQKHVVAAAFSRLSKHKAVVFAAQMRTGKAGMSSTLMNMMRYNQPDKGIRDAIDNPMKANQFNVVLCPPHLVDQWVREIHALVPDVYVYGIKSGESIRPIEDVKRFLREIDTLPAHTLKVLVCSREMIKMGDGWEAAYNIKTVGIRNNDFDYRKPVSEDNPRIKFMEYPIDPVTGERLTPHNSDKTMPIERLKNNRLKLQIAPGENVPRGTRKERFGVIVNPASGAYQEAYERRYGNYLPQDGDTEMTLEHKSERRREAHKLLRETRSYTDLKNAIGTPLWQEARQGGKPFIIDATGKKVEVDPGVLLAERKGTKYAKRIMPLPDIYLKLDENGEWRGRYFESEHEVYPTRNPRAGWGGVAKYLAKYHKDRIYMLIADEFHEFKCFPANTKVATPSGDKNIQDLNVGDLVLTMKDGQLVQRRIVDVYQNLRNRRRLVRIVHENGSFIATEDHKIYVDGTYVQAGNLQSGMNLTMKGISIGEQENRISNLPNLRYGIHCIKQKSTSETLLKGLWHQSYDNNSENQSLPHLWQGVHHHNKFPKEEILFARMSRSRNESVSKNLSSHSKEGSSRNMGNSYLRNLWQEILGKANEKASVLLKKLFILQSFGTGICSNVENESRKSSNQCLIIGTDEGQQPYERPGSKAQSNRGYSQDECRPIEENSGRQWKLYRAAATSTQTNGLGNGIFNTDWQSKMDGGDSRPSKPSTENCNRGRWAIAQNQASEKPGPYQGSNAQAVGVGHTPILELGCAGQYGCSHAGNRELCASKVIRVEPVDTDDENLYDLEVEDTHRYFAENILVSNCDYSAQGIAMGRLANAATKVVGLTGTLYGGKASTLFALEFFTNPNVRRTYGWEGLKQWIDKMGVLERTVEYKSKTGKDGRQSERKEYMKPPREVPGASPELLAELIDHVIFFSLRDLGDAVPELQEEGRAILTDQELTLNYMAWESFAQDYNALCISTGDSSFLGVMFAASLSYLNYPYEDYEVWHTTTQKDPVTEVEYQVRRKVYTIPGIGERLTPKENDLIQFVQQEVRAGRGVTIFVNQSGKRPLHYRLEKVIRDHVKGAKPAVLTSNVSTGEREEWLNKKMEAGVNVLICNPNLVKTGLSLIAFPTGIFYETPTSLYTVDQAAHRPVAMSQDKECKAIHYYYHIGYATESVEDEDGNKTNRIRRDEEGNPIPAMDTMEARIVKLIDDKAGAADYLYGEEGASLHALSNAGSSILDEIAKSMAEGSVMDAAGLFKKSRKTRKHEEETFVDTPETEPVKEEAKSRLLPKLTGEALQQEVERRQAILDKEERPNPFAPARVETRERKHSVHEIGKVTEDNQRIVEMQDETVTISDLQYNQTRSFTPRWYTVVEDMRGNPVRFPMYQEDIKLIEFATGCVIPKANYRLPAPVDVVVRTDAKNLLKIMAVYDGEKFVTQEDKRGFIRGQRAPKTTELMGEQVEVIDATPEEATFRSPKDIPPMPKVLVLPRIQPVAEPVIATQNGSSVAAEQRNGAGNKMLNILRDKPADKPTTATSVNGNGALKLIRKPKAANGIFGQLTS